MASSEELQAAWIRFCNSSEAYGIDEDVDAAAKLVDDALDELVALRTWRDRAMPLLAALAYGGGEGEYITTQARALLAEGEASDGE